MITIGSRVHCRQTGNTVWVVRRRCDTAANADVTFWHLVAPTRSGHLQGRVASEHDLQELAAPVVYAPGQSVIYRGEVCTIEHDDGDHVVITTPAFAKKLYRGRGWVQHPEGSKQVSKAALLLDNEL